MLISMLIYHVDYWNIQEIDKLNERKEIISFDKLINGSISDQIEILQRFKYNMVKRKEIKEKMKERQSKKIKENSPCEIDIDPLNCTECRFG